jgi:methylenetetrahydrofolate dehydrogenase (NADP+)/methenyltetrahydrofolate cyclohydrolase
MKILDGKKVSEDIKNEIKILVDQLKLKNKRPPHLAAILVGSDGASLTYVSSKVKACNQVGFKSSLFRFDDEISEKELLGHIEILNLDKEIDGFIVQLPLPKQIDEEKVLLSINPEKDVDGFHPENAGLLSIGRPRFIPCTPKGIMFMLKHFEVDLNGKHVVVVGRSNIVGRPVSVLSSLKSLGNATVTICHSGTSDLKYFTKQADVVVAAMGSPEFLDASFIKEGACLVDVGINRIERDGKSCIVGDVNQSSVTGIASSLTPVPKGVGPMTIAMLVENTILSAELLLN